jgi:predicted regulator of Ras-like GTPase activity (Roadblock/LC7/MglB family)
MFQYGLQKALQHAKGARGIMLLGFDGIPIASLYAEGWAELEPRLLASGVELANIVRKANTPDPDQEGLPLEELCAATRDLWTVARVVAGEFLLVLVMDRAKEPSAGSHALRLLTPQIERELR